MFKCSDCKKLFLQKEKGCKIKPKPLCSRCVFLNKEVTCGNSLCHKTFLLKKGWIDHCFECDNSLCKFCVSKTITLEGLEFYFCENHKSPDRKDLKEEAIYLSKEI